MCVLVLTKNFKNSDNHSWWISRVWSHHKWTYTCTHTHTEGGGRRKTVCERDNCWSREQSVTNIPLFPLSSTSCFSSSPQAFSQASLKTQEEKMNGSKQCIYLQGLWLLLLTICCSCHSHKPQDHWGTGVMREHLQYIGYTHVNVAIKYMVIHSHYCVYMYMYLASKAAASPAMLTRTLTGQAWESPTLDINCGLHTR